ncbi:MAG: hypothetical protein AB7G12_12750 [Thermoanaerobaculia bacterium]
MASAQENNKLIANNSIRHYDFDPDGTDPVDVAWVDMRDFAYFLASFFRTVGTSNLDTIRIIANSQSNGGGTDVEVKVHALGGGQPNAVGDQIFLECTAQELAALSNSTVGNLRYVSLQVEFATGTDEAVITYIRSGARFPGANLTADVIA